MTMNADDDNANDKKVTTTTTIKNGTGMDMNDDTLRSNDDDDDDGMIMIATCSVDSPRRSSFRLPLTYYRHFHVANDVTIRWRDG